MGTQSRWLVCTKGWTLLATIEKRNEPQMLLDLISMLLELKLVLELELTAAQY